MKKKKALDHDILLAAQDIAKRARQYLAWHEQSSKTIDDLIKVIEL